MADANLPINFQELLQLTSLGVQPGSIGFSTLTMESDHFIWYSPSSIYPKSHFAAVQSDLLLLSIREKVNEANNVLIVDLYDNGAMMRRPITADSAIMHPTSKIIALKAQRQLQIFNLELKSKLKSHVMNEDVTFWKWINEKTIGLVTETSVYHWLIDSDVSAPQKIFERHTSLQGSQIISYKANSEDKWMVLIGISQQAGRVVGNMQLYSRDRGVSQPIEGHAAAFSEIQLDGAPSKTKLFTFAVRSATGAKV